MKESVKVKREKSKVNVGTIDPVKHESKLKIGLLQGFFTRDPLRPEPDSVTVRPAKKRRV